LFWSCPSKYISLPLFRQPPFWSLRKHMTLTLTLTLVELRWWTSFPYKIHVLYLNWGLDSPKSILCSNKPPPFSDNDTRVQQSYDAKMIELEPLLFSLVVRQINTRAWSSYCTICRRARGGHPCMLSFQHNHSTVVGFVI
jgi:hypothetical protein